MTKKPMGDKNATSRARHSHLQTALILLILPIWMSANAYATDYYVKNGGNDNLEGRSDAHAWATTNKINSYAKSPGFSDGDIIHFKRGSTWNSGQTIGYYGTSTINWGANKTITFRDYGDTGEALPLFDGDDLRPFHIDGRDTLSLVVKNIEVAGSNAGEGPGDGLLEFAYLRDLVLDGVIIDGHKNSTGATKCHLVRIKTPRRNVTIQNCNWRNAYHKAEGIGYWRKYYRSKGEPDKADQTICGFTDGTGKAPNGGRPPNSGDIIIQDSVFEGAEADLFQFKGINYDSGRNIFRRCRFSRYGENAVDLKNSSFEFDSCDFSNPNAVMGGTGGFPVDLISHYDASNFGGRSDHIKIHDCLFHDGDTNAFALSKSDNTEIYNNLFLNQSNMGSLTGDFSNAKVYNNVYVNYNGTQKHLDDENGKYVLLIGDKPINGLDIHQNSIFVGANTLIPRAIWFKSDGKRTNCRIRGNILSTVDRNCKLLDIDGSDWPAIDHNIYYGAGSTWIDIRGATYGGGDQAAWQKAGHAGELFANPRFKNPGAGDLSLQDGPAVDFWKGPGSEYKDAINWDQSSYSGPGGYPTVVKADQAAYGRRWEAGAIVFGTTTNANHPPATNDQSVSDSVSDSASDSMEESVENAAEGNGGVHEPAPVGCQAAPGAAPSLAVLFLVLLALRRRSLAIE